MYSASTFVSDALHIAAEPVSQQLCFPVSYRSLFFIKSHTDEHYLFPVYKIFLCVVFLFYLVERILCAAVTSELKLEDVNTLSRVYHTIDPTGTTVYLRLHKLSHQLKDQVHRGLVILFPQLQVFFRKIIIGNACNKRLHPLHE